MLTHFVDMLYRRIAMALARWRVPALLAFVGLFALFAYTLLHEGGHALVGVLSGASVTTLDLNFLDLGAHVGLSGSRTPSQETANNLAGALLPLLVWVLFIAAVPRRANLALEALKVIGTVARDAVHERLAPGAHAVAVTGRSATGTVRVYLAGVPSMRPP